MTAAARHGELPLTAAEIDRLVKLLGMLGSHFDGERAAAGALAHRLVRSRNLTWADVIAAQPRPELEQRPRTWRDDVNYCRNNDEFLTAWEHEFLNSIALLWSLTPKQQAVLDRITSKCRAYAEEN